MTYLRAQIRKTSKYHGQTKDGEKFAVSIAAEADGYVVQGGPGGRYRLSDVHLFALADDSADEWVRLT